MNKLIIRLLSGALVACILTSCSVSQTTTTKAPPGQVKKQTGSQSAKPYAPGQQKKVTGSQSAQPYAPGQQKKKKK